MNDCADKKWMKKQTNGWMNKRNCQKKKMEARKNECKKGQINDKWRE